MKRSSREQTLPSNDAVRTDPQTAEPSYAKSKASSETANTNWLPPRKFQTKAPCAGSKRTLGGIWHQSFTAQTASKATNDDETEARQVS